MRLPDFSRGLALLGVLLAACATTAPVPREEDEAPEAVVSGSWEEARADPSCVVPLCAEERCALWRCRDVVEVPPVLLAQAVVEPMAEPLPPLPAQVSASRWWGLPLAAPTGVDPVFEIPWHDWKVRERLARETYRFHCDLGPREPYEKHHIFPRAMRVWFTRQKIDVHAYTIRLPRSFHRWLHSGGPEGGQWNEAWRQFISKTRDASPEAIWRFAGELMSRFGVFGPLVPYYCD